MDNQKLNTEADSSSKVAVSFGLVFENGKIIGFKMPEHSAHKEQAKQQLITIKDKKIMLTEARRCLEAWQRWTLMNNGYGNSSLACLTKVRATNIDHTPNLSINRSASYAIEALSIMERGDHYQQRYAKLIKAVILNQQQKETPRKTLERLGIAASAKQYSTAEHTIARVIADIQKEEANNS